ncbi:MAG: glycerophosphodiester phosphodiesterase [Solirubrobacterales bacterium]
MLGVLIGLASFALGVAPAAAQNPWPDRRVLNIAHQGGEFEFPSNTMYAFQRALEEGADVLELDVHATADGRLAVIHDAKVDRTTDGTGFVSDFRWHQLRKLDAAYNFVPGRNAVRGLDPSAYPLRGVRTGDRKPPRGFQRKDFRVPSLSEVFQRFRDTPINIEIKGNSDSDQASFDRNAKLLAEFLNKRPRRADDVIVVSFNDDSLARFSQLAPGSSIAPGLRAVALYVLADLAPPPETVAIQIPVTFQGILVPTPEFVARAHADGFAVHVFPDAGEENDALYDQLLGNCVDGIMTAFPTRFESYLRSHNIVRPGVEGVDPCE